MAVSSAGRLHRDNVTLTSETFWPQKPNKFIAETLVPVKA